MPSSKASASFPAALLGDNWQVTRAAHRPLLYMWRRLKRYNSDVKSRRAILPETERRNPRSAGLDRKSTIEVLRILNREDASVPRAVARELPAIARAVDKIVRAFRSGGRLIYVGAGSSGRMGALDAAECPPTFGVPETQVQAILAGGLRAMTHAVEGAEDSPRDGARQIAAHRVGPNDVVVGIRRSRHDAIYIRCLARIEAPRCNDRRTDGEPAHAHRTAGAYRHRSSNRARSNRGLDSTESRDSAEIGTEHALYCRHGTDGICIR